MASSPRLKAYSPDGEYIASFKHEEDAAMFVGARGGTIRLGHSSKDIIWCEKRARFSASDSYDRAAEVMRRNEQRLLHNKRVFW